MFYVFKQGSRDALRGSRKRAVALLLIEFLTWVAFPVLEYLALSLLPPLSSASALAGWQVATPEIAVWLSFWLLALLVRAPLALGSVRWYRQLVAGEVLPLAAAFHFFSGFSLWRRAVWLHIRLSVRTLLWCAVFFLLPCGVYAGALGLLADFHQSGLRILSTLATLGFLLSAMLFSLFGVLYAACMNKYALAGWLICSDDNLGTDEAIRLSIELTKGVRAQMLLFQLSFLGYAALSLLFFPFFCYFVPFRAAATALFFGHLTRPAAVYTPTQEFSLEDARLSGPKHQSG